MHGLGGRQNGNLRAKINLFVRLMIAIGGPAQPMPAGATCHIGSAAVAVQVLSSVYSLPSSAQPLWYRDSLTRLV